MAPSIRQNRSVLSGVGIITLLVIVTVSGLAAVLNNNCQRNFWDNLAVYPGAQQVETDAVFLGIQRAVYHSPDAPETVERWYATEEASSMREAVVSGDFSQRASQNWIVEPDEARGGSRISAQAVCP